MPGTARTQHRAVDVVAVVLAGALRHEWADGAAMVAGDVAVLRAGTGLEHDEVAGDAGARVSSATCGPPSRRRRPTHEVHRAAPGWVDLDRPDARLWMARVAPGDRSTCRPGCSWRAGWTASLVEQQDGRTVAEPGLVLVWQLDAPARPSWARARASRA